MNQAPKLNRLYKLQFEKAQDCHVLLFPEGMIKLNPSAAEILLQVDGCKSNDDIVAALKEKFPDAPDDIAQDIQAFLADAATNNWIKYE